MLRLAGAEEAEEGRPRRPLAVVWDRLKSCGSQHAATTLSWLSSPTEHIAGWGVLFCFYSIGRGLRVGERERSKEEMEEGSDR